MLNYFTRAFLLFSIAILGTQGIKSTYSIPTNLNASKIVVIADLHADVPRFREILQYANILDTFGEWIAPPDTVIVQLGDQIDPKPPDASDINDKHHFAMIYFTDNLGKLANKNNCSFISLIGNHELYNIERIRRKESLKSIISHRPIIYQIGEYIFCHGGLKLQKYKLLQYYDKPLSFVNDVWYKYVQSIKLTEIETTILNELILDTDNSILFTRIQDTRTDVNKLFELLNVENMFVGHTAFDYIHVKDRIWYLDLYLKDAFDDKIYSYICIEDDYIMIKQLETYTLEHLMI
jgi:hypothetical protein